MSSEMVQKYVERRVRELIAEGLTSYEIVQQLKAIVGKRMVLDELQKVSANPAQAGKD